MSMNHTVSDKERQDFATRRRMMRHRPQGASKERMLRQIAVPLKSGNGIASRGEIREQRRARGRMISAEVRENFWNGLDRYYENLKRDPVAWQQELEERRVWEGTLNDGLENL